MPEPEPGAGQPMRRFDHEKLDVYQSKHKLAA